MKMSETRAGALAGVKIIEFAGIGPGPFCAMMLADHGAQVIRIDRLGTMVPPGDVLSRSRRTIMLDLKKAEGQAIARKLCADADGLIEGFRPGVMERLGLGPEALLADNPALVYGRMTGWGQYGPYAQSAGHDLNYIALSGVLHGIGRAGAPPVPPMNYVGDFGGGGMMLAFGIVSALLAVKNGAPGQVIDCAMTDGSAMISAMTWAVRNAGAYTDARGANMLDGAAHFYDSYACADGHSISIGSIEPQFYALLRQKLGLDSDNDFDDQHDKTRWPQLKQKLAALFRTRTRDEWCALLEMTDVCFAPVLALEEAPHHPHNVARETFITVGGHTHPAPAPRFSVTSPPEPEALASSGADTDSLLAALGYEAKAIADLRAAHVIA
jgi:alpha-methylacyl-CoA racemase